jgi:hypothetical protein
MAEAVFLQEVRCFPEKQASISPVFPEVVSVVVLPLVEQVSQTACGKPNVALRLGYQHFVVTNWMDGVP